MAVPNTEATAQQTEPFEPAAAAAVLDVSITDGEGEPVDISTVSSILADEDETDSWIPTTAATTFSAEFMPCAEDTIQQEEDGDEERKERYKEEGEGQIDGGWENHGEKKDQKEQDEEDDEDDMSSTVGTDESPSPPLAHVTDHPSGRDEGDDAQEQEEEEEEEEEKQSTKPPPSQPVFPTSSPPPPPPSVYVPLICLQSGLAQKADPTHLKSWIALSLTLDGRDKLTKLCQYASRLLAYYYESIARSVGGSVLGSDVMTLRLLEKAAKFRGLQMKLTESRKAYRLGRSLVELDKIRSMGWGRFLAYHMRRLVVSEEEEEGGAVAVDKRDERGGGGEKEDDNVAEDGTDGDTKTLTPRVHTHRAPSNVGWGPVTTIATDGTSSTTTAPAHHEPEHGRSRGTKHGRPRLLLRRASTNIGWGPVTAAAAAADGADSSSSPPSQSRLYRSLSNIGQRIYRPLTSQLALSYGGPTDDAAPSAPAWKIIGSTLKLLGLMGFWLGDNVNFLGSSGLLDDTSLSKDERARARGDLRRRAGHFAARAYFMGAVSGLYVNLREVLSHRREALRIAVERVHELEQKRKKKEEEQQQENDREKRNSWDMKGGEDGIVEDHPIGDSLGDIDSQLTAARADLEKIKGKQFVLFLALLKSCCDVIVFSNNPGIDLHKRYRGRKMNEGFHSLCGLLSASTVLYNNFPNKVVKSAN